METTIKRVLVSEHTKRTSSLEFNGWKLTIVDEGEPGKQITTVSISGSKAPSAYLNYQKNGQSVNVNFNNSEYDTELMAAIQVEIDDITQAV